MARGLLLLLLLFAWLSGTYGDRCPRIRGVPGCVCATREGVIDLTSIANKDGKT